MINTASEILTKHLFTDGRFDSRRWRNASLPEVKLILDQHPGRNVSEKVYSAMFGAGSCIECGGLVKLNSFNAGWKDFCSTTCAQKNTGTREKAEATCLRNNGGRTIWEIPGYKDRISKKISDTKKAKTQTHRDRLSAENYSIVDLGEQWEWTHSDCGTKWQSIAIREKMRCPRCTSSTGPEVEIVDFIKTLTDAEIKLHNRTVLYPKELDIFIPDFALAIEYNGAYWHRESDPRVMQKKITDCGEHGIRLITILESDWTHKKEAIKSLIRKHLLPLTKIGARKLKAVEIDKACAKKFVELNHFAGWAPAQECLALMNGDEVLMVATFGKNRFSKSKASYELIRLCSLSGTVIQGGISKIIKHWAKIHEEDLISFHDLRFGWGDSLKNAGFELVEITRPSYRWVKGKVFLERWATQKKKIHNIVTGADLTLTEDQIMCNAGWIKEYNPGNSKWLHQKHSHSS